MHAIYPNGSKPSAQDLRLSPGVVSRGHIFVTGMTGSLQDGTMPDDPATQFHAAFDKIRSVLVAAGTDTYAIVEMTSYHVGIHDHFDLFNEVRCKYVCDPFPAWTAVEVAGLRRQGALVEVRVIAEAP
ncbi:RidA family protein [Sulfitobacter sp.]|jgi:enamine deaminase RidA (YjgF/YER057c/UK114 family)|uniref:RidA family protein n=1 Tax=Sulfitobacter sp. TaxID=1903071 RepID=UPI0030039857